jgi:hypothetical protein
MPVIHVNLKQDREGMPVIHVNFAKEHGLKEFHVKKKPHHASTWEVEKLPKGHCPATQRIYDEDEVDETHGL